MVNKTIIVRENTPSDYGMSLILEDAKIEALDFAKEAFAYEQQRGFPKDPDDYQVFLRNRGRQTRRQSIASIRPDFLRIPFDITVRRKSFASEDVALALRDGYMQLRRILPVRSGILRRSVEVAVGPVVTTLAVALERIRAGNVESYDRFRIVPMAPWASSVEALYYDRDKQGLSLKVTRWLRAKYGPRISVQFRYIPVDRFGASYRAGRVYNQPVIEIAGPGVFSEKDSRPAKNIARRRRRARRAAANARESARGRGG